VSRSLNLIMLIGNAGANPRVETTRTGRRVATFSLVTDRPSRAQPRPTDWHTVVAWDRLAEEVERSVRKGDRVYVEGSIDTRVTESPRGKRSFTEIIAADVIPLGSRTEARPSGEPHSTERQTWQDIAERNRTEAADLPDEEELPF
jgi:single-strand DNA-binding protein